MFINKANLTTDGNAVRISMPIGKVDVNKRIVSGFATLDNLDKQNDIVETSASLQAFKNFRGNLREMHQPNAVGRIVSFKEDKYFDPNVKKFYSGVYVSAYVSKGAQDTWEKVLDGTLTGFSIGGSIDKFEDTYNEELSKTIRIIKEYSLSELSLVDNPANQFANIVSIEKVDGKNHISGFLSKTEIDNVFWCKKDDIVQITENTVNSCPSCSDEMKNIGFVEKNDSDNIEEIRFLVDSAKGIRTIKMTKEENPMTEENNIVEETLVKSDETVVENVEVAPEAPAEAVVEAPAEEAPAQEPVAEVAPEATEKSVDATVEATEEIAKAVSEVNEAITNALSNLAETVKSLQTSVDAITKSLETVTGEVKTVANEVSQVKGSFNEFGKRVDAVEKDTAFRKSGDLGEIVQFEPEKVQKSLWGGRFLKTADLFN